MTRQKSLALLAIVVIGSFAFAQHQRKPESDSIATLMKEREQTLLQLVEIAKQSFEQGDGSIDSVIEAERDLLDARLESATTRQERIEIREAQLDLATQQEAKINKLTALGVVSPKDSKTAKVNRLNAEIELLREKQTRE